MTVCNPIFSKSLAKLMILDSLVIFDVLLLYLYAKDQYVKNKNSGRKFFVKFRILILMRCVLLVLSVIPFLIHFTRKTIRKIAICRIAFDLIHMIVIGMVFYKKMIINYYDDMQSENKLIWPSKVDPASRFWGALTLIVTHLIIMLVIFKFYYSRTLKLMMIKDGGLSDKERGLVIGLAPGGRSRTSTEIDMGMRKTDQTYVTHSYSPREIWTSRTE